MKLWQVVLLSLMLLMAPILTACGTSRTERLQQEAYEAARQDAIKAYQKQMDDYNKAQEEYQRQVAEAYKAYTDNLTEWYRQQQDIENQLIQQAGK